MMKQVCKFLQKIELSLISLFLAGMVGVVFLATIARYSGMFNNTLGGRSCPLYDDLAHIYRGGGCGAYGIALWD